MNHSDTPKTALVVDDSEMVCRLLEGVLGSVGFRVSIATNDTDAMKAARSVSDVDLLICPLAVSEELAARVAIVHPSTRVLFTSYLNMPGERAKPFEFLPKPFDAAGVLDAVERVFSHRPPFERMPVHSGDRTVLQRRRVATGER